MWHLCKGFEHKGFGKGKVMGKGKQPKGAYVYVAGTYPDWRKAVLEIARRACADASGLVEKKVLLQALKADPNFAKGSTFEKQAKLAMQLRALPNHSAYVNHAQHLLSVRVTLAALILTRSTISPG